MKYVISLLALVPFLAGCASTPQVGGVQGVPVMGRTSVKVGKTSVMIVPQKRVGNGIVFVMEDGRIYWSKRYIENNDMLRFLPNKMEVDKWVHLSPVSENQVKKGDVILVCKSQQLYCIYY
jgi:hypothetical protein